MEDEITSKAIEKLNRYIDSLRKQQRSIIDQVGDLLEAENLNIYQEIDTEIEETEEIIDELEGDNLSSEEEI